MTVDSSRQLEALAGDIQGNPGAQLKRVLGAADLTLLGVGGIIGAGIFVLSGTAAAQYAGPAVVLSFAIAGLACVFAGLCYSEMAAMIPVAGSAYTYAHATLGELAAWVIGWDLLLEYLFGAATVAVGWSGYFTAFLASLGVPLPPSLIEAPLTIEKGHQIVATGAIVNLPAVAIVLLMTGLLVFGIRESARFNFGIVTLKVMIILLVVGLGFGHVNTANWMPFVPENSGSFGQFGWSGVVRGAGVVFFAYIGFDAVSTAAQEAKHPQRDVPIGILGSLGICTLLYVGMALVLTGLAHYTELNVPHPVYVAIAKAGPSLAWLGMAVNVGAVAGLSSVVLVLLLAQPRVLFAMARDGLLPRIFTRIHPRYHTPYVSTLLTGGVCAVLAGLFPIGVLGELVSIGTLLAFVIVCAGVWILRRKAPNAPRPFRAPGVPWVPLAGILTCFVMMALLPLDTWIRLIVWLALGMAIYFSYGRRRSRAQREAGVAPSFAPPTETSAESG